MNGIGLPLLSTFMLTVPLHILILKHMSESTLRRSRSRSVATPGNGKSAPVPSVIENSEVVSTEAACDPAHAAQAHGPHQKQPTADEIYQQLFALINEDNPLTKVAELRTLVCQLLQTVMKPLDVGNKYNWLVVHDPLRMTRPDADTIYKVITKFSEEREIGLIITSGGGQIEPAYLISKLCRESTTGKVVAVVPRRAKSGATLVCCGADEIHMGQMSELGPIDPQFDNLPALGLKNAVQHLAELASQYPKAADMFAKYLATSLDLVNLGYYERVAESAVQYAERLLRKRVSPLKSDALEVAKHLVYGYKDHGFVIDRMEAESIFGQAMIKGGTSEYELGNSVYEWLSKVEQACDGAGYSFYLYGAPDSDCNFVKKKR